MQLLGYPRDYGNTQIVMFVGIPSSWIIIIPNMLGSIIPQLIIIPIYRLSSCKLLFHHCKPMTTYDYGEIDGQL